MPVLDGVQATRKIMQNSPCAILIVTATVSGHASLVFEAMGYGALDVVKTPVLDPISHHVESKELLAKIDRIALLIDKSPKMRPKKQKLPPATVPLLLIGSSTGGPMALVEILSHLPKEPPFGTVIIQHVDEQFAPGLGTWLQHESGAPVEMIAEGMRPKRGVVLLAGKNDHLIMDKSGSLHYTVEPVNNPYRPSVDVFYLSVASYWPDKSLAILLTGMGADGAKGMKALRDAGWHTIAQDEESSIVFGMPRAAIELGGASEVLPLSRIAPAIVDYFAKCEVK
jgi:two-component system response regulator WspF